MIDYDGGYYQFWGYQLEDETLEDDEKFKRFLNRDYEEAVKNILNNFLNDDDYPPKNTIIIKNNNETRREYHERTWKEIR